MHNNSLPTTRADMNPKSPMNTSESQNPLPQSGLSPTEIPLSVYDLTVAYHRKPVIWDVSFDIPPGKLVGIVGPNGAGKSTLIKTIMELIPKASGRVNIFGKPYQKNRHRVGYVPQRESVDWDFPVDALDVVTMGLYREIGWCLPVRKKHRERALDALERVGIADYARRQISQLSGGQQQRTFLARALVQDADLYLMDEPFAAVDAATEKAIVKILQEMKQAGKTALVIHHDLQTVPEYFDYVILLNMRVIDHGPTADVFTPENLQKTYGGRLTLLEEATETMRRREQSL
ncbi:High-affinity zinc uptake system ATP-binding protein ZnuC [Gimesia panareensis]|uniref:High-affinity zinc uptake system ATP-binding protein ZnuC n=2 Tax=Gimesia panareensis TaxID=2527978 RepID=A0A517Q0U4_9PLAN|nr:High-affinity zinc uptake system ATP-binding protein ZnuC [Gimesia panareensis]QDU48212.1 High-affinity zinc uptake system ATP-binding protein ZnuC [Gimesia panareensis]